MSTPATASVSGGASLPRRPLWACSFCGGGCTLVAGCEKCGPAAPVVRADELPEWLQEQARGREGS